MAPVPPGPPCRAPGRPVPVVAGRAVNRQIRQLAAGLMVLLRRAVRRAQLLAGRPQGGARRASSTTPGRCCASSTSPAARSSPPTARRCGIVPPGRPRGVPARLPDRRSAVGKVRGYFTLRFGATKVEREYGECSPARPPSSRCAAWRPPRGRGRQRRHRATGGARRRAAGRQVPARRTDRVDRRDRAADRRGAGDVQQPVVRPQHVRQRRLRGRPTVLTDLQNAPGNPLLANAYQERYMPGSTFKVITTGIGLENGVLTSTACSRTRPSGCRRRPTIRSRTTTAAPAAATWRKCSPAAATSRSQDRRSASGPRRCSRARRRGASARTIPLDLAGAAASSLRQHRRLGHELPLLAIRGFGQSETQMVPLHMAMVAGDGRQRRPDDGALRRRSDATTGRPGARGAPAEVWKTPISPTNGGDRRPS